MSSDASRIPSPFHEGEQQVQERMGVQGKVESFARRAVRDHLPEQHREFYERLPFVLVGSVDAQGRPWASLIPKRPGFMTSPDARRLDVAATPVPGDPLEQNLRPGQAIGLLGIELETRRRNRLTGEIGAIGPNGFTIAVNQTFGNCPQYIQRRGVTILPDDQGSERQAEVRRTDRFDAKTQALIAQADTLFIATAYGNERGNWSHGVDVSHRGGKPGFVKVEDDRSFVFPDFSGNNHFNTVGNLLLNPKAGFLFVDFKSGDLVYLTGTSDIVWDGEEVTAFAGAERLIRFTAEQVIRIEGGLPLRFDFADYSPTLNRTGSWAQAAETLAVEQERNSYISYEIFDIRRESDAISSFYLRRADGKALTRPEPGQFLPIRLTIPGQDAPVTRTYTLSNAPNADHYRLSVKREDGGALVSTYLHTQEKPGFRLEAMAPRGKFILDRSSDRPVVLLSAGVGITPMIAMANSIIDEGRRTGSFRRSYFIHGTRNSRVHAFGGHIRTLAAEHESLSAHIRYSQPGEGDELGITHDSVGHIDIALLKDLLPFDDYDFYLCGPRAFMQRLYDDLRELGVRDARIHYESFGPATVLKHDVPPAPSAPEDSSVTAPVTIRFARSAVEAEWSPDKGTLLDLAEDAGLTPPYSCRSGVCGTCATRLISGTVDYREQPLGLENKDEVLICSAIPRPCGSDGCGDTDSAIALDL